ncbi:MAG: tRNA (guanosine(46)-N7)-methyltransferase TrmB [Oscillospiraceae bacterium]|jgi:tRNA (guanine-N7-)-methyltransferase|nr:tRNA (guanosine(46)-N7)-methyltransferase TrmB [Oscillospiraceae bacterium]
MRRKNNLNERIDASSSNLLGRLFSPTLTDIIQRDGGDKTLISARLNLQSVFENNCPLELEIGCGKGGFITETAARNPSVNYLGVEKSANVAVALLERLDTQNISNVRLIIGEAEYLLTALPPLSVRVIYLNFSCPYPKGSYAKRRLTHPNFLRIYRQILAPDGVIKQKTDNQKLFEFSKNSFNENGFVITNVTDNLHDSDSNIDGGVMTEYERRFSNMGLPIHYLEARIAKSLYG